MSYLYYVLNQVEKLAKDSGDPCEDYWWDVFVAQPSKVIGWYIMVSVDEVFEIQ